MDVEIHFIETEAYGAVLRAFIAQSEVLSWGKEELITELRKELRVSDAEHREILGKINLDESIKSIREWRKGTTGQQLNGMNPPVSDPIYVGYVPHKRLKVAQTPVLSSPKYPPRAQSSLVGVPPPVTTHAGDGQRNSTVVLSPPMNAGQPVMPVPQNRHAPTFDKVRRPVISQTSNKGFVHSGFENSEAEPHIIEIRATDKLINEVEKICGGVNPDPGQVERAKLALREHERALVNAIRKLANLTDDDVPPAQRQKQRRFSNEEREMNTQDGAYEHVDRSRINYGGDGYILNHPKGAGILCVDFQNGAFDKGC